MPRVSFDQFKAFIDWQLQPHPTPVRLTPKPFVTISRQAGSGAVIVAQQLARQLEQAGGEGERWTVFDKNLADQVLADQRALRPGH